MKEPGRPSTATGPTHDEVAAGMRVEGFLAPSLTAFIPTIRSRHAAWFDYASRLNEAVSRMWGDHPVTEEGLPVMSPEPVAGRLFARAMSGFQAAILMLERGMVIEAGTMARSVYETGFWLAYLRQSPQEAVNQFEFDELNAEIGRHQSYLGLDDHEPEFRLKVMDILSRLKGMRSTVKLKKLRIDEIAAKGDCSECYTLYRILCGPAHASVGSTDYYMREYPGGEVGHEFGPDLDNVPHSMVFACHAMLVCSHAFAMLTKSAHTVAVALLNAEFHVMADKEPMTSFGQRFTR